MRTLRAAVAIVALLFVSTAALAVMLAPTDKFEQIDVTDFSKLEDVTPFGVPLVQEKTRILRLPGPFQAKEADATRQHIPQYMVLLVRFDQLCVQDDFCLTAVFANELSKDKFFGFSYVPPSFSAGDVIQCTKAGICSPGYIFVSGKEGAPSKVLSATELGPLWLR